MGVKKKRYSRAEMRRFIIEFCSDWKTAEEIAKALNKSISYIRDTVLPQLSDILEKKYDVPHHPKQKYRAKNLKEQ